MTCCNSPIGSADDVKAVEMETGMSSVPDMFFSRSFLKVSWSDFEIQIDSKSALMCAMLSLSDTDSTSPPIVVDHRRRKDLLGQLSVKHANDWSKGLKDHEVIRIDNRHDWTYTTTYWGSIECLVSGSCRVSLVTGSECSEDFLPWSLLRDTACPVTFFKEIELWEDELSDNGSSKMSTRIRFMGSFIYIMIKFDLRVDGVLDSRSIETRIFHQFDSREIRREFRWIENGKELQDLRSQQLLSVS